MSGVPVRALSYLMTGLFLVGCGPPTPRGPVDKIHNRVLRMVTRSRTEGDIHVQVTFRTFAYELVRLYSEAEKGEWDESQLEGKIKQIAVTFADSEYPEGDGGMLSFYRVYKLFHPDFDATNPIDRAQYEIFRNQYTQKIYDLVRDRKFQRLRTRYNEEWGYDLFGRLVFSIYMENEGAEPPPIRDIGAQTVLEDDEGHRYTPQGNVGPYPYAFDQPQFEHLEASDRYRVFFVNRRPDRKTPIIQETTTSITLVIEGLGEVPRRAFTWELPLNYPLMPEEEEAAQEGPIRFRTK